MKVGIVTDRSRSSNSQDREAKYEDIQKIKTIGSLKKIISKRYDCIDLIFDEAIIQNLKNEKVNLVFNLCNGVVGESRLSQFPGILESIEMPYTGSNPFSHALASNKIYSGKILKENKIATPSFISVSLLEELDSLNMKFPLFIKPSDEGSSRGIYQDSIVEDKKSLYKKVEESLKRYNPPIMIMEYVIGREFTVGLIENGEKFLPILEVDFSNLPLGLSHINSFEIKNEYEKYLVYHLPAKIDKKLKESMKNIAKKTFTALDLKDYSRIDIIVRDNVPYVIEANSLPGLQEGYSDLWKMAEKDSGYEELVFSIINSAIKRYKL